jgi:sugar-specific transcriptional regulator TrmB
MHEDILKEIGLSTNESKVYSTLLRLKEAPIEDIAAKSKVHRRNVYDSLAKLMEKGLISEVFLYKKKFYRAINPSRLIDILAEKEQKLKSAMPNLEKTFQSVETEEKAYIYRGIEGFKNYLQDILDQEETVYFIGAKAFWFDPRLEHYLVKFQQERKKKKIKFMHLFDYEVKEQKPEILKAVGKPYRFLPKKYSSSTAVDIFGDMVVTFVGVGVGQLPEEPVQFVMQSRRLADGYRKFFRFMWDHSESGSR